LCPAAHTQRWTSAGRVTPPRTAGTKSASSTQLAAAANTSGATLRQRHTFDQNHSEEYTPPMGARYWGAWSRAIAVMTAASSAAV
jgi:activator of HSP90 ATPase